MHSIKDILLEIRKDSALCKAVEMGNKLCFKNKCGTDIYCGMHRSRLRRLKSFNLPIRKKKNCKFVDCKSEVVAKGYCNAHYRKRKIITGTRKCTVECCSNNADSKYYCSKHRTRLRRHGDLNANFSSLRCTIKKGNIPHNKGKFMVEICIVPECNIKNGEPHRFTKGLCRKHFMRWKKWGDYNISSKKEYLTKINKLD